MKNAIARLAYTRKVEADYKDEVAAAQAELETSGAWKYLEQQRGYLKTAKADVADAETEVRKVAREIFTETDGRAPHPAVTVREATEADCNWGLAGRVDYPIVSIARDLSGYLPTGDA